MCHAGLTPERTPDPYRVFHGCERHTGYDRIPHKPWAWSNMALDYPAPATWSPPAASTRSAADVRPRFPNWPLRVVAALVAGLGLVDSAGCGAAPAAAPPAPAGAAVSSSSPLPPGEIVVTGAVRHPGIRLTLAQLKAMPTRTTTVSFGSAKGTESHTETGVPVATLLDQFGLATDATRKDDELSFAILAIGADGYRAVVSYGEISPTLGNRGVLVSIAQDGIPLAQPRLIVPGDVKGGRDVTNLVRLHVTRVVPH